MNKIKKFFHFVWAVVFSAVFAVLLLILYQKAFFHLYQIDILAPKTYRFMSQYWDSGATLSGEDLIMLFAMFSYIPLCLIAFFFIYRCRFVNLILIPLNKLSDMGFSNYKVPNVNIKNLKVEEKKTLEQFIQERVEKEKGKSPPRSTNAFRNDIITEIEKRKK